MTYLRNLTQAKIAFIIVILFGILFTFYLLITYINKGSLNFESKYCLNSTHQSISTFNDFHTFTNNSHHFINFMLSSEDTWRLQSATLNKQRKVFLVETSGKPSLNARQACAVESAARQNSEMQVIVYFTSTTLDLRNNEILALMEIPNISFQYLNLNKFFNCTPLYSWFADRDWIRSPYRISHLSDALRFLTLWKYGGIYLDLDVIVIKSLTALRNFAGKESEIVLGTAAMSFDEGHDFLLECLNEFSDTYSGSDWGWNGPQLITRVLKRFCGEIESLSQVSTEKCKGVSTLPSAELFAIRWKDWMDFYNASKVDEVMKQINHSYLIHVWNKHSSKMPVKIGSGQPYELIARKYCPSVYSCQKNAF